ncbi:hypothetical protein AVEN_556-1 [Araneus ventricosus]|uniref:Uncharacterized protein n=1 Tax=Araneus ventricosus TaxID=182803 RepID=A0A4Y2I7N9_ARAVE|nr:hypothetical protein AVEN_556-1 [Araneus ventricosus]
MESQLRIAVLFFTGLFVSVQGLSLAPENLEKYEKCWNYANCLSNGKDHRKMNECIQILRPDELKSLYQTIRDFHKYKSENSYDVLKECCELDDAKKLSSQADPVHKSFRKHHSHKTQGFRSGDRGRQAVGKWRLIILSFPKCRFNSCFTGVEMCGGAPSCIKTVYPHICKCCSGGMSWLCNKDSFTVQVTGPEGPISSKNKGPTKNAAVPRTTL